MVLFEETLRFIRNTFDVSDILSASQPKDWNGSGVKMPADRGMISFWNEAIEKFKQNGIPDFQVLKK